MTKETTRSVDAENKNRETLEGWVPEMAGEEEVRAALEQAFDYRGDVMLTLKAGETVVGYLYDRRQERRSPRARTRPPKKGRRRKIGYGEIAAVAFTGRDTAAGKSWEAWVKKFEEKKAAGEKNIGLLPDELE